MAGKYITTRMGISKTIVDLLSSKNLSSISNFLHQSDLELLHQLNLPFETICLLIDQVCTKLIPPRKTIHAMIVERHLESCSLKTRLSLVDAYLRGGLPSSNIIELVGSPGVGKTQFCLMLSVLATLPLDLDGLGDDTSILYIDSGNNFSSTRIFDLAQSIFPSSLANHLDLIAHAMNRIIHLPVTHAHELNQVLNMIDEVIIEKNIKLIVIDSIASLVQKEFDQQLSKRQHFLSIQASRLKQIAESYKLFMIVTNQIVTTSIKGNIKSTEGNRSTREIFKTLKMPALGIVWAHCINIRILIQHTQPEDFNIPKRTFPALIELSIKRNSNQLAIQSNSKFIHQFPTSNQITNEEIKGEEIREIDKEDHCHQRITLRKLTIAKSPISPVVSFPFVIHRHGLFLIKDPICLETIQNIKNEQDMNSRTKKDEKKGDNLDNLDEYLVLVEPSNFWNSFISTEKDTLY